MRAGFDDSPRSGERREAAKVSQTLLRDNDLHRMFAVINVRAHGHNGRDPAAFGG